jgi:hypothetical protein
MAKPRRAKSLTLVRCTTPFRHQVYRIVWRERDTPACRLCGLGSLVRETAEGHEDQTQA